MRESEAVSLFASFMIVVCTETTAWHENKAAHEVTDRRDGREGHL